MKILIADDDAITRIMLSAALKRWGYEAVVAKNGDEALNILLRDDAPPIAIVDWMMPGRDGAEVCRELREAAKTSYTYLLMLSGKREKEDFVAGLASGADDYVRKPVELDELHARIQAIERIVKLHERLRSNAHEDPVTGVLDSAGIRGLLGHVLAHAKRHGGHVSVIFADIDGFKRVRDAHGSAVSEAVLREVSRRLWLSLRAYDAIGRLKFDEFLIALPGCAAEDAERVAERLRAYVAAEPISTAAGALPVTVSLGVAATEGGSAPVHTVIAMADEALYRAKQAGRNRVMTQLDCNSTLHAPYPPVVG